MAKKYKFPLRFIGILLIFSLIILITYLIYLSDKDLMSPLVVVESDLSINYPDGNRFKINKITNKNSVSFTIINTGNDTISYYISLEDMKSNEENINISLTEKNNVFNLTNQDISLQNNTIASSIEISPGETHNYTLTINNASIFKASIDIGKYSDTLEYFADTILKQNTINYTTKTNIGTDVALDNEGLIAYTDEEETIYYFRGNVLNNYVNFANLVWRIVRINSDGSIRLILNDYIDTMTSFYDSNDVFTTYEETEIYSFLNDWYEESLRGYETYLASSTYCLDDSIATLDSDKKYYLGNTRLLTDYAPTFNCQGTEVNSRIGLLTADEAVFAGASPNSENESFYLYTPDELTSWWTLTPSIYQNNSITYFTISSKGLLESDSIGSYFRGAKPVINLHKKVTVTGTGTEKDPYILE